MKIIGINGIWIEKAEQSSLHSLISDLRTTPVRGFQVPIVTMAFYPLRTAFERYFKRFVEEDTRVLLDKFEPGDILVAHSAGAGVVHNALRLGIKPSLIYLFNAAFDSEACWVGHYKKIYNIYNPKDTLLFLAGLLPWHDFGQLGRVGYRGCPNERIIDVNGREKNKFNNFMRTHSDFFKPHNVGIWSDFIINTAQKEGIL